MPERFCGATPGLCRTGIRVHPRKVSRRPRQAETPGQTPHCEHITILHGGTALAAWPPHLPALSIPDDTHLGVPLGGQGQHQIAADLQTVEARREQPRRPVVEHRPAPFGTERELVPGTKQHRGSRTEAQASNPGAVPTAEVPDLPAAIGPPQDGMFGRDRGTAQLEITAPMPPDEGPASEPEPFASRAHEHAHRTLLMTSPGDPTPAPSPDQCPARAQNDGPGFQHVIQTMRAPRPVPTGALSIPDNHTRWVVIMTTRFEPQR